MLKKINDIYEEVMNEANFQSYYFMKNNLRKSAKPNNVKFVVDLNEIDVVKDLDCCTRKDDPIASVLTPIVVDEPLQSIKNGTFKLSLPFSVDSIERDMIIVRSMKGEVDYVDLSKHGQQTLIEVITDYLNNYDFSKDIKGLK